MAIRKRKTSNSKSTDEYHYEFMCNGRRYYGVCEGCTTERTALAYEKRFKATIKKLDEQNNINALVENFKQELTGGQKIKLNEAFDKYLEKPRRKIASPQQQKINRSQWNDFCAFSMDKYPEFITIDKITKSMAEAYISNLQQNGRYVSNVTYIRKYGEKEVEHHYKTTSKLSPRTINAYHKTLKSVFSKLKEDAGLLFNPFDFEMLDSKSEIRDAFTIEELELIGRNLDGFTKPIFLIGICTGLSMGDICLLRWSAIREGWIVTKRRKTGTELEIPILPPLAQFFSEQQQVSGGDEYILPEHSKMYLSNSAGISYRIRKFLENLGITTTVKVKGRERRANKKGCHAIRHTFAYMAGLHQIPMSTVQAVLGHSSTSMTMHYQRHADRKAKEQHFKQMPDFLSNTLPIVAPADPEREELKELIKTLPIETIKAILIQVKT
jgi:integrase